MSKIFHTYFGQGSLKDRVSGTIPINSGITIKRTRKGRGAHIKNGDEINSYGVVPGVKTLAFAINPSGNTDIFLDDGIAKLSIVGGNVSGTGLTECTINNVDTDVISFNALSLVIAEFSGGIDFSTDFEIDPISDIYLLFVSAHDSILTAAQKNLLFTEFSNRHIIAINPVSRRDTAVGNFLGNTYAYKSISNYRSSDSLGSIVFWIRTSDIGNNLAILSTADEVSNDRYFYVHKNLSDKIAVAQKNNDATDNISGNTSINDGKWHHVVVASTGSQYKIYVDGNIETLTIIAGDNAGDWFSDTDNRDNVTIGVFARFSNSQYFTGNLANIAVYNVELSQDEILQMYHGIHVARGLVSRWAIDERGGAFSLDQVGSDNLTWYGNNYYTNSRINAILNIDGLNWDATGETISSGKIGDCLVASGSFKCLEDSTGKYIECVTNGNLVFNGLDLSEFTGNGYIIRIDGDLSSDAGGTVDDASNVSFSGNLITVTTIAGQKIRNLTIKGSD